MDRIRIRGGHPLKGEIPSSGAKNAALKLMAASLLTAVPVAALYIYVQRFLVEGLTVGGVKG